MSRGFVSAASTSRASTAQSTAQSSAAARTPIDSSDTGDAIVDGNAGGGAGNNGGGSGKRGGDGDQGGSDGEGGEAPWRPSSTDLMLLSLAAAAILGVRWALLTRPRIAADDAAAQLELVNRSVSSTCSIP